MNMGGVLLAMTAVAAAGPGASPLMGRWGGEHAILIVTAEGGRLSLDCGAGAFQMPGTIDANGDFAATGTLDVYAAGPTRLRAPSSAVPASYRGAFGKRPADPESDLEHAQNGSALRSYPRSTVQARTLPVEAAKRHRTDSDRLCSHLPTLHANRLLGWFRLRFKVNGGAVGLTRTGLHTMHLEL